MFPLSNWTELDVWEYIRVEGLELPPIYFAHEREVFERDGMLYAVSEFLPERRPAVHRLGPLPHGGRHDVHGRGPLAGAELDDVIAEIAATRITERGETRADDRVSEAAMEDRKRVGTSSAARRHGGPVDDGKSTLIGRLLHDSKSLMADEIGTAADLARLTDGLRAEREQGITIDVAYRHFATPNRRFVLHDCPGHAQYTRNMATGASTADLALVLVDARRGMTEQSRRHLAIAALLGVPNVTVLVNKMDLVGYAEERFDAVAREVLDWSSRLGLHGVGFIPVSALHGDNVVDRSEAMPWYGGQPLLEHLESVPAANGLADGPARLPVQYVIRADGTRWYAGRLGSGTLASATSWSCSRRPAHARPRLRGRQRPRRRARSIAVALADELDVGRGDLLARPAEAPEPVRELTATVCWLGDEPAVRARAT